MNTRVILKDKVIGTCSPNQVLVLNTKDKAFDSDLIIYAEMPTSISVQGNTYKLTQGEKIVIHCNNKMVQDNIALSGYNILSILNYSLLDNFELL